MRAALLAVVVAAAACNNPPLKLVYQVADGASQSCGGSSCSDVKMECDAVLSIRVVDPSRPTVPYISVCEPLARNRNHDLCTLASVDLPTDTELPKQTLEVQVLVWPRSEVIDPATGEIDCTQTAIRFDATNGFPIDQIPTPALGGHAYFHPGDEQTVVTLGCTDLDALNDPVCIGASTVAVTATVDDFDTHVSVSGTVSGIPGLADRLNVSVGEPRLNPTGTSYVLNPADARGLDLLVPNPTPTWGANVDLMFQQHICLEVLEDGPQATTAVACDPVETPPFDIRGIRLSKATLQQVLTTLGMTTFPDQGMTIGIVLDDLDNPSAGSVVTPTSGTIQYLSADRMALVSGTTSASGVFVSVDAPFGTDFTAVGPLGQTVKKPGGLIDGKVTVVVLQYPNQNM